MKAFIILAFVALVLPAQATNNSPEFTYGTRSLVASAVPIQPGDGEKEDFTFINKKWVNKTPKPCVITNLKEGKFKVGCVDLGSFSGNLNKIPPGPIILVKTKDKVQIKK